MSVPIREQFPKLALLLIPAVVLLGVLAFISTRFDIAVASFTRDPLAIVDAPPYLGFLSNLGIILWSAAAAVCLFAFSLLSRRGASGDIRAFVLLGGLISLLLLLDDLYMLHEYFYPRLGIFEKLAFAGYGVLVLVYLIGFRRKIGDTRFVYLFCALGFFALSLIIDRLPETMLPMHHLFEDGSKFLGIVCWLSYQASVCLQCLEPARSAPESAG
jgi:hypothetical protein